jgi:hypothetical protein
MRRKGAKLFFWCSINNTPRLTPSCVESMGMILCVSIFGFVHYHPPTSAFVFAVPSLLRSVHMHPDLMHLAGSPPDADDGAGAGASAGATSRRTATSKAVSSVKAAEGGVAGGASAGGGGIELNPNRQVDGSNTVSKRDNNQFHGMLCVFLRGIHY